MLSHCKDIDLLIMRNLDGEDLINLIKTSKWFYNLANESFWKSKVEYDFEKFKELFTKITWKDCYIIEKIKNPFWLSAKYLDLKRSDLSFLLETIRKVRVIPIQEKNEQGRIVLKYYTRDRTKTGIKEGKYLRCDDFGGKLFIANYKDGIRHGKTKEYFVNRFNVRVKLYKKVFHFGKVIFKTFLNNGKYKKVYYDTITS